MRRLSMLRGACAAALAGLPLLIGAVEAGDYFKGKTISVFVGGDAASGYDAYARLLASHYPRHIPGNPAFTVRSMPGERTLKAANFMFEAAPKDGTAIGAVGGGVATAALFHAKGARFDPRTYLWIGSMNSEVGLVLARRDVPVNSIQDVFQRELLVGGRGPASDDVVFPAVMNKVLGTRFRIIPGYTTEDDIARAIERGEIEGSASWSYSGIVGRRPDWISSGRVRVLLQDSLRPHTLLPNVPVAVDLAKTSKQRVILELVFAHEEIGRPFLLPPGTPNRIAAILRRAFAATMADPRLLADAKRRHLDINRPMFGVEIEALLHALYACPADAVVKAAKVTVAKTPAN